MSSRGRGKFGCLVQIVVVAVLAYYGFDWGQAYYKYWSLREEMRSQAGLAAGVDDATSHRRILAKIDALDLPDQAKSNISIRRRTRPREIVITTSYVVQLRLPFRDPLERTLNLEARQPL